MLLCDFFQQTTFSGNVKTPDLVTFHGSGSTSKGFSSIPPRVSYRFSQVPEFGRR